MTTLVYDLSKWQDIKRRIKEEYGDNFFLIRFRVERELGFTTRNHREFYHDSGWKSDIRLDFQDSAKATFFQIKYL